MDDRVENEVLEGTTEGVQFIVDQIRETPEESATMIIIANQPDGEGGDVDTIFVQMGYSDIIEEALFGEVATMVDNGDLSTLKMLKRIVEDVMNVFDMDPEDLEDANEESNYLH